MKITFRELERNEGYSVLFFGKEVAGCYSGDLDSCLSYLDAIITPIPEESVRISCPNITSHNEYKMIDEWRKSKYSGPKITLLEAQTILEGPVGRATTRDLSSKLPLQVAVGIQKRVMPGDSFV